MAFTGITGLKMKKKITSKENLKDMALNSGATITDSKGKTFNSTKKQAIKRPKPAEPETPKKLEKAEPAPKPEPPLNPETADEGSKMVAESLNTMSKANVMMLAELKSQIAAIQFNAAQPVTDWEFDFIRDDKGYLVKLIASAQTDKRTIN